MRHLKLSSWSLFIFIFFLGCEKKKFSDIKYNSQGRIEKISLFDNNKVNREEITFFENGNIKHISNYSGNLIEGEQLNFYANGKLESKLLFKNNLPNGVSYWFYESGALRASRFYVDGKQNDLGFDYWDYKFVINKALVRFNNGKVYFKLNFDSSGKPTTKEGDSLHADVENIK